jgi:hypothetical protein
MSDIPVSRVVNEEATRRLSDCLLRKAEPPVDLSEGMLARGRHLSLLSLPMLIMTKLV